MKTKKSKLRRWFSMMELVIVIGIMALLAAIAAPNFFQFMEDAKVQTAKTQCDNLKSAIMLFGQRNSGKMPGSLQELADGGYMDGDLGNDPWGNPYNLLVPGAGNRAFEVTSNGPPGKSIVISCWSTPKLD